MSVGEAQITRLNRERLAAIKNFLPIRDRFRDNLQRQQQARTESSIASAELFKPITGVTEQVGTEVGTKVGTEIAKIVEQAKKTEEVLQKLPTRIEDARQEGKTLRQMGEIDASGDIISPPPEFSDKPQQKVKKR